MYAYLRSNALLDLGRTTSTHSEMSEIDDSCFLIICNMMSYTADNNTQSANNDVTAN